MDVVSGRLTRQPLGHGEASMEACLLVIDADPFLRARLSSFLQADGFQVLTAADAREDPRTAYEYHPDLVILGLVLPDLDGRHMRVRLRELSDPPILTLAEGSEEETIAACLEAEDLLAEAWAHSIETTRTACRFSFMTFARSQENILLARSILRLRGVLFRSQRSPGWVLSRNVNLGAQIAIGSSQKTNDFQKSLVRFLMEVIRRIHPPVAGQA